MNETIRTIMARRSTRAFKQQQITDEELNAIVDCGVHAPSAKNTQNWHFSVVQNAKLIERLNADCIASLNEEALGRMTARGGSADKIKMFYNAPTIIVISGQKDDIWSETNMAMATENMCLAAESVGVGSCIIGFARPLFSGEHGAKYFNELCIPEGYGVPYILSLGYKAADKTQTEVMEGRVTIIK